MEAKIWFPARRGCGSEERLSWSITGSPLEAVVGVVHFANSATVGSTDPMEGFQIWRILASRPLPPARRISSTLPQVVAARPLSRPFETRLPHAVAAPSRRELGPFAQVDGNSLVSPAFSPVIIVFVFNLILGFGILYG